MIKTRKYIYGIINSNTEKFFDSCRAVAVEDVHAISYEDISAVVSDSQFVDFTTFPKNQVARYLLSHQQVIEKIMDTYTIIPMRLGTYALNKEEVEEILSKGYKTFNDTFKKVVNKIEVDVVATWSDFSSVLREVSEEGEIKEFKQSLLNKKEGITVDDQIKIGAMINNHLNKIREKYALEIQTSLSEVSEDMRVHGLMDDKMVTNSAFLISKDKQKDFDKKIEELNTKFNDELNFRCVGPLPPYSFYTLEIKRLQFEAIDWARKKLRLSNNLATKDEIKKAHRTMAFSFHPDKNPGTPIIEREFDEITKAYKMLCEYCSGESCCFDEEAFKENAVSVKVRE